MTNRGITWARLVTVGVVAAMLLVPITVRAAESRFGDVDDANPFLGDIEWLADAGVTRGCNPPTNDMFCPGGYVTREQMAAFMHRQAGYFDSDDDGSVNDAETVAGYAPWEMNAAYALSDAENWLGFADHTWAVALELDIDPPGDGLVYVTGLIDHATDDTSIHDLGVILCTDARCGLENWGPDVYSPTTPVGQVVTTALLPVNGDGDTLRLWMRAPNLGPVDIYQRSLTALYVPFGFAIECDEAGSCVSVEPGASVDGVGARP
jgi:hypothetical protein